MLGVEIMEYFVSIYIKNICLILSYVKCMSMVSICSEIPMAFSDLMKFLCHRMLLLLLIPLSYQSWLNSFGCAEHSHFPNVRKSLFPGKLHFANVYVISYGCVLRVVRRNCP